MTDIDHVALGFSSFSFTFLPPLWGLFFSLLTIRNHQEGSSMWPLAFLVPSERWELQVPRWAPTSPTRSGHCLRLALS